MNFGKREEILGRIREALRVSAPRTPDGPDGAQPAKLQPQAWLPAVPPDAEGQLVLFQKNCLQLRTDLRVVTGLEGAAQTLAELHGTHGWSAAAAHHHPLLDALIASLGFETWYVEQRPTVAALEQCSVGITACDALVAQTGSILLTARSAGGRALSVLPPHHVVIAHADQLVPDLPRLSTFFRRSTATITRVSPPSSPGRAGPETLSGSWCSAPMGRVT